MGNIDSIICENCENPLNNGPSMVALAAQTCWRLWGLQVGIPNVESRLFLISFHLSAMTCCFFTASGAAGCVGKKTCMPIMCRRVPGFELRCFPRRET